MRSATRLWWSTTINRDQRSRWWQSSATSSTIPVKYCTESHQNIPLARNKAVENAEGDLIAFIDDDEFPIKRWLLTLFEALNRYGADGVLGPVKPYFENEPPKWVIQGKFYDRPSYPTGVVIDWRKGRTGNVLLKRVLFSDSAQRFNPAFRTGEDGFSPKANRKRTRVRVVP